MFRNKKRSTAESDKAHRIIFINESGSFKRVKNKISTTKYSIFSFIPRFLFEQFRKYANVYFLCITLLQQIPDVSPTGRFTTLVPLCIILSLSAVREIIEDLKRKRSDDATNSKKVPAMTHDGTWKICRWADLRVGDVVQVSNNEYFPADLIILSSSEPTGMCYIETSNLDGETNLKVRQALDATLDLVQHQQMSETSMRIELGHPNKFLYDFIGNLQVNDELMSPIGPDQLLLRGARLKNTKWIFGAVAYAGYESKLMLNSNKIPLKRSSVDRVVNRQVLMMFCVLLILSWVSALGSYFFSNSLEKGHWYIGFRDDNLASNLLYSLLTFLILYNNLIPISLQVTLEMVKFMQAIFIGWDLDMNYEVTKTPAAARTSNLNEELGQVKYIFSDKTGTLTCNIMALKYCYVGGTTYWKDFVEHEGTLVDKQTSTEDEVTKTVLPSSQTLIASSQEVKTVHPSELSLRRSSSKVFMKSRIKKKEVQDFMVMCAICHTVVPEVGPDKVINYQASSPDERALVLAAKKVGFEFIKRTKDAITIKTSDKEVVYHLLNIIEFTSDRKRMTAIVKDSKNSIKVLMKGADSVIMELLNENEKTKESINERLNAFSTLGLRTLCFGQKNLTQSEYDKWNKKFYEASISLVDRDKNLENVAAEIEKGLSFVGISAIEDKLQDGVPETIFSLLQAGIKIWVLTGDKQETAINIGMSSQLISADMDIIKFNHRTLQDTKSAINMMKLKGSWKPTDELQRKEEALVIDGKTLTFALVPDCTQDFFNIASRAKVVICCRVSPSQKTEIVRLVKEERKHITLAIGDGANDVGMIQEAHVGIGISGQEGLQAVCASDYSIAQFRFLRKLLLVHGHWNYDRVTKLILFSFYKNICFYFIEFWYAMLSAFSGQIIFERWTIGLYNVIFTAMPPVAIGIFDQVAPEHTLLANPHLYKMPQSRAMFNVKVFWLWCLNAIYVSLIVFWIPCGSMQHDNIFSDGKTSSLLYIGNVVYSIVIITVALKALIEMNYWNLMVLLLTLGSMVLWILFLMMYCNLWPNIKFAEFMVGMDQYLFSSPMFYLQLIIVPIAALLRDIICKIYYKNRIDQPQRGQHHVEGI